MWYFLPILGTVFLQTEAILENITGINSTSINDLGTLTKYYLHLFIMKYVSKDIKAALCFSTKKKNPKYSGFIFLKKLT